MGNAIHHTLLTNASFLHNNSSNYMKNIRIFETRLRRAIIRSSKKTNLPQPPDFLHSMFYAA